MGLASLFPTTTTTPPFESTTTTVSMDVEDFGLSYARFIYDDHNNPYSQLTGNFYPVQHNTPSPLEPVLGDLRVDEISNSRYIPQATGFSAPYLKSANPTPYHAGFSSTSSAPYLAPPVGASHIAGINTYDDQVFAPPINDVPTTQHTSNTSESENVKTSSDFWNDVVLALESGKADDPSASANTLDVHPGQYSNIPEAPPTVTYEITSDPSDTSPQVQESSSPTPRFLTDDERWDALTTRDPLAEGHFYYCVLSTRIYCRPVCPARRPARNNVAFVKTIAEAQALGCRPCKRCMPNESIDPTIKRQADVVERLKKALFNEWGAEGSEKGMTVKGIAEDMGVSMWHLNRLFKSKVGMPPKAWAQAQRRQKVVA
ncbi:hypothetical protein OF83DRAFT_1108946 [Amylostereum chailletii]|nr:hypothetical protein OF83DRAFT_1108946 [Amylostereum chailletii]